MPRAPDRKPRRAPKQRTSTEIVDAIIESAASLIKREGLAALTTNHVAEKAGVSIGSLYRYFPDKESIVAELDLRHRRVAAGVFMSLLPAFTTDFKGTIRRALAAFVEDHDPDLRRVLMRDVPVAWVDANAAKVWSVVVPAAAEVFRRIRPELSVREARLRVFVVLHSVQGVATGLALWPLPDVTVKQTLDVLVEQVSSVLLAPKRARR